MGAPGPGNAPGFGAPAAAGAPGFGAPPMAPAGQAAYGAQPMGYRSTPAPPYASIAPGTPARGGVVFVIIGLSVVIAILLIVLLWALFARG
jgi:hypothetical protein